MFLFCVLVWYHSLLPQSAQRRMSQNMLFGPFISFGALVRAFQPFLHLLVGVALDDCLVPVLKHHPVLFRIVNTAVIFE